MPGGDLRRFSQRPGYIDIRGTSGPNHFSSACPSNPKHYDLGMMFPQSCVCSLFLSRRLRDGWTWRKRLSSCNGLNHQLCDIHVHFILWLFVALGCSRDFMDKRPSPCNIFAFLHIRVQTLGFATIQHVQDVRSSYAHVVQSLK